MSMFADLWKVITDRVVTSPRESPSALTIPAGHVEPATHLGVPFEPDEHYFQVRINEMYLTNKREWFSAIDPLVFVVSEFTYNNQELTVPYLVGPKLMEKWGKDVTPQGMIFRDTRVAGLHPYRGGRLTLSVVLCQTQVHNYARQFLRIVESAANALDFSTMLGTYVKVAGVVMDGFEALVGLGGTEPLAGLRREFDPDAGDAFSPSYFVLIDKPGVDPQTLWVNDRQLLSGPSMADAKPYRDADFVLYSVVRPPKDVRSDISTLPFHSLWERVEKEAAVPQQEFYKSAKANMLSLYEIIMLSPDLTKPQAAALADEYAEEMVQIQKKAQRFADLDDSVPAVEGDTLDEVRGKAVSILDR
jgi:hypothetical protein